MLDLKFVRENPEIVKENIRKKFQDAKLPLVDEVIALDEENRKTKKEADDLRADRNRISKQIGALMGQGKKEEAEACKKQVTDASEHLAALEEKERELEERIRKIMLTIPNIIDPSVPIGKDDSENVEVERFGEPAVPDFEIPYHTEIMEKFSGIDLDSARKVAGNGFYYLHGRYRQTPFGGDLLRAGFYDRTRLYLLRAAVYDPQRRGDRRNEFRGDGRHDV